MAFGLNIGDLLLTIIADGSGLRKDIERQGLAAANAAGPAIGTSLGASIASGLTRGGKAMENIGMTMTRNVTLPVMAAGFAITKVGLDFDTALRRIIALTDVTADQIGFVRDGILELATAVGKSPQELAEAFYFLASGGFNAKESMEILTVAAKAAASGLGETQQVAQVIGASINAFGRDNLTAADATDQLIRAIKDGTAEAPDFAGALGDVVGSAAILGATFSDTAGAMAAMTLKGINADEAATSLNQVFRSLIKTTPQAKRGFASVGLTVEMLRKQLREEGLIGVLKTLEVAFKDNDVAAGQAFGNVRALRGVLALIGTDAERTEALLRDVAGGSSTLGTAFEETNGPARKIDKALARIKVALIELSVDVLPFVVKLFERGAEVIEKVAGYFKGLPQPVRDTSVEIIALTAALGPLLFIGGKVVKMFGGLVGALTKVTGKIAGAIGRRMMAGIAAEMAGSAASEVLAGGVADGVSGIQRSGKVTKAIDGVGKFLGTKLGRVFGLAFLAAATVQVAQWAWDWNKSESDKNQQTIADAVQRIIVEGNIQGMKQARDELQGRLNLFRQGDWFNLDLMGVGKQMEQQLASLDAAIAAASGEVPKTVAHAFRDGRDEINGGIDVAVGGVEGRVRSGLYGAVNTAKGLGRLIGSVIPPSMADGILAAQEAIPEALKKLRSLIKGELTPTQQIARDIGILTSKELADALRDKRPGVAAEAKRVQQMTVQELSALIREGGKVGEKAMDQLRDRMHSKNPRVRREAKAVYKLVKEELDKTVPAAGTAGTKAANNFISNVRRTFNRSGAIILKVRTSDDTIGGRAGGGPVFAGQPYWVNENTPRTELFVPSTSGHVLTHADAMQAVSQSTSTDASVTIEGGIHLHGVGSDVGLGAQRKFAQGVLDVVAVGLREQTARMRG